MDYQVRMETAFDNYFRVSSILTDDLKELVKRDMTHDSAKRNFIRAACSLIEGYGHCFREILAIGLDMVSDLTKNQIKVIRNESGSSLSDRAKCTLTAMHKMFELEGVPDFGNNSWEDAKFALKICGALAVRMQSPNPAITGHKTPQPLLLDAQTLPLVWVASPTTP